jgi:hypothetical protein
MQNVKYVIEISLNLLSLEKYIHKTNRLLS